MEVSRGRSTALRRIQRRREGPNIFAFVFDEPQQRGVIRALEPSDTAAAAEIHFR